MKYWKQRFVVEVISKGEEVPGYSLDDIKKDIAMGNAELKFQETSQISRDEFIKEIVEEY